MAGLKLTERDYQSSINVSLSRELYLWTKMSAFNNNDNFGIRDKESMDQYDSWNHCFERMYA